MLLLGPNEVRVALPMPVAIEAMRAGFRALARGQVLAPLRTALTVKDGTILVMPAALRGTDDDAIAVKVVSVFPGNKSQGVPAIHGLMPGWVLRRGDPAPMGRTTRRLVNIGILGKKAF